MAYQTGTSTSVVDLLDKFRLFAIAQGWTVNRWVAAGSGYELCISKGSAYFNFRAYANETALINGTNYTLRTLISMNGSDGYDAGLAWDRQPGYPVRVDGTAGTDQCTVQFPLVITTGPFPAYHFFAYSGKTLYAEVEITTGTFLRFGCGSLDLFNPSAPGGGRFIYSITGANVTNSTSSTAWLGSDMDNGSYHVEYVPFRGADFNSNHIGTPFGSMVRVAFGSFDNWAGSGREGTAGLGMAAQGGGCHDMVLREFSKNPLNGIAIMFPNIVSLNIGAEFLSPIGVIPGMRYLDLNDHQSNDEFTLGPDTWKVFPWYQKGGISYNRGIAYKKEV